MKRWEYRNIHILLAPVYLQMVGWSLRHLVTPFGLLKANYALDHGGATFASKYGIQMSFPQQHFPLTRLLRSSDSIEDRVREIDRIGAQCGYPVIVKPDQGRIGFGVSLLRDQADARTFAENATVDYLVQEYVSGPLEFGVFYVRKGGQAQIFSINSKEFPAVTGDGRRTVRAIIADSNRLSQFSSLFNTECFDDIPRDGEEILLSVVGSHTLGCIFRDATDLRTPAMLDAVDAAVGIPGFNFGRLDVRTPSVEAFQRGDFVVLEVNGIESLTTNAFDPRFSYWEGLRWFSRQFRLLVEVAAEHRAVPMKRLTLADFVRHTRKAEANISAIGSLLHFVPAAPPERSSPQPGSEIRT